MVLTMDLGLCPPDVVHRTVLLFLDRFGIHVTVALTLAKASSITEGIWPQRTKNLIEDIIGDGM